MSDKSSFQTFSNSVNILMQTRLMDEGYANYRYRPNDSPETMIGIEPTSTALAMAIVKVFSAAPEEQFQDTSIGGILCLVVDRKAKSRYLRVFDINSAVLLFQSELYVNFAEKYTEVKPRLYCFPLVKTVIGLSFAN